MTRSEIKKWAKEKIKGKTWNILAVCIIANLVTSITASTSSEENIEVLLTGLVVSLAAAILALFMDVGLIRWMTNFINDKETKIEILFTKFEDWKQVITVFFHQLAMITLYTFLFIIPGIIKAFSYSLVSYILAEDSKLSSKEVLDLSAKMMKGHKMNLFIFNLSFIGWHFLAIFTLGILELWIIPYQTTATTKYLLSIKEEYEKKTKTNSNKEVEVI